jgi:hypothetical protein
MGCETDFGELKMNALFSKYKIAFRFSAACVLLTLACGANAKPPQESSATKAAQSKDTKKASNESDTVLSKNAQATLYLLAGWGKAEGSTIWYTVSAHFNKDQVAPEGKPFNLFSASGAMDCKANSYFYYRTSYLFFNAKTGSLNEVYFEKNKSNSIPIDSGSIEDDVKNTICK